MDRHNLYALYGYHSSFRARVWASQPPGNGASPDIEGHSAIDVCTRCPTCDRTFDDKGALVSDRDAETTET